MVSYIKQFKITAELINPLSVWGRVPWLSPIGHSHLVLISVIMMMGKLGVV